MCASSVLRLFMITVLILWSVADIETYAIAQPHSRNEKLQQNSNNEVRSTESLQNNRKDNNTGSISTDANIYLKTTSERNEKIDFSETSTTKLTKVKVNLDEIEDKVVTNTSEMITPMSNVNETIRGSTIKPTPQTNILSMTTNRPRRRGKNKNETANNNTTQDPPIAKTTTLARAGTGAKAGRILGDDVDLSMIDVDDDADGEVNVPKTKHRQINTYSTNKVDQYSITLNKKIRTTNFAPGTASVTDAQKPQSHIYKVNSNYKRYKKLNIIPPKSLWRDPNDNSWRNESISSLGIKFKPNANTTNAFQLRKKDLSELDTLASDTENITGPGLRERLEKLSEIRKSKKKCNTSMEISDDDFVDYESESTDPVHTETTYSESPVTYQDTILKTIITKTTTTTPETPETSFHLNNQRGEKRFLPSSLDDSGSDSKTTKIEISETAEKDLEKVIAMSKFHETEYKNEKPKNTTRFQRIKYDKFDYDPDVENNYEYDQYDLNVSKDLLNSSESWSEKKTVNTEQNPNHVTETSGLTEFTKILDSLAEYLNSNKGNTTRTAVTVSTHPLTANNFGEMYKYTRPQAIDGHISSLTEPGTPPKFTRTEDFPIGPRNKDKISLPQSYSYNTIPHKQMSVQYNNTVIHQTAQENLKNYNIPAVTKAVYHPIIPIISNNGNNMQNNFHQNIDSRRFQNFPSHRKITAQNIPSISQISMNRHGPVLTNVNIGPMVPVIGPIYQNIGSNPLNTFEHNMEPISQNIGAIHIIANHKTVLADIPLFKSVASIPMNANHASLQHQEEIFMHSATSPGPVVENFPNNEPMPKNTAGQGQPKHFGNESPVLRNTNQHESRYGARKMPQNSIVQNAPSQVSMLQDIARVQNLDHFNKQTQMPINYNNTMLNNNIHKDNYDAVPNAYLKGIYDEMLSTKIQDTVTPSYGDEYQENVNAELPSDYQIHY